MDEPTWDSAPQSEDSGQGANATGPSQLDSEAEAGDLELRPDASSEAGDMDLAGVAVPPPERDDTGSSMSWLLWALPLLALLAVALWYFFLRQPAAAPPAVDRLTEQQPAPSPPAPVESPVEPTLELPPLDESDELLRRLARGMAGQLSSRPELTRWLATEELAQRFVAAVDNLARGESPRRHLLSLEPGSGFQTEERGEGTYASDASYRRFDLISSAIAGIDTEGALRTYRQLEPLFDEAYRNLGYPDTAFRTVLTRAMDRLSRVPVPAEAPQLVEGIRSYRYADERLENLPEADKQLLRLGPANARQVQEKLRELRAALESSPP